jgi:hypothetical protein
LNVNTPGSHDTDQQNFYDAAPLEPHLLYQGEILVDVPLLVQPKESRWQLLRTRSGKRFEEALAKGGLGGKVEVLDSNKSQVEWYAYPEGDFAAARLSKRPVLVLSQTCDVQNKEYIQVAPIYPVPPDDLERVKSGELYSVFYLPAQVSHITHNGFADLEQIQSVHRSYIRRPFPEIHFRLKDAKVRELQQRITRYFGRPNSFDVETDTCPRTGTYLCVACFYLDGAVTPMERTEGQRFEYCPECNSGRWILRGR